ncbi:hypothetical protein JYA64_07360 [Fictibacillus barbaricus]|uniref:Uncharacterized protein n=2 Tax=Fictibacillus barbaricus TaxID=182136 RepID=A0ABS2ZCE2_9BACL|nr:hypothetical protein [Fictibacillus barbaricus]
MKVFIPPHLLEEIFSKRGCCICKNCIKEYHFKMNKGLIVVHFKLSVPQLDYIGAIGRKT